MRILIACEESQTVTIAFRNRGFECYSCDIQDASGGHPEWHIKGDALEIISKGNWDMIIAHPPCTYLSRAGARWLHRSSGLDNERFMKGLDGRAFFMSMLNAPAKFIAVENPTPLRIFNLPPHTQAIQPYQFGHPYSKRTLLWLKNLPPLIPTQIIDDHRPFLPSNTGGKKRGQSYSIGVSKSAKQSSKTFNGVANAMADQWGSHILKNKA